MSKVITVLFFKDGTHEVLNSANGILVRVTADVMGVYNAKSQADAQDAISAAKTLFTETAS